VACVTFVTFTFAKVRASGEYPPVGSRPIFGYARPEDGVYIGYRVDGDGPIDFVSRLERADATS
jgi:hypothetical protein